MNEPSTKQIDQAMTLISLARTLNHYESLLTEASGEHFNFFNILGVGHLEARTHTPILAELLNPSGSHGQGPQFLNIFLTRMGLKELASDDTCEVLVEHYIGPLTETTGGRIDILIKTKNNWIIIENKIYADLQENQLLRYQNYAPNAHLLYLTLSGEDPLPSKIKDIENLNCISYEKDIINWLEACRKESAAIPTLRESLTIYINLVKQLTNQNLSSQMNHQIVNAVLTEGTPMNLRAFNTLKNAETAIHERILEKYKKDVQEIAAKHNLKLNRDGDRERDLNSNDGGFEFGTEALTKANLEISLAFERTNYRDFYFGFARFPSTELEPKVVETLRRQFTEKFGDCLSDQNFPAYLYWEKHRNWTDESFESIYYGSFRDELNDLFGKLVRIADVVTDAIESQ